MMINGKNDINIDFNKLKERLSEIDNLPKQYPPSPLRGLTGDLSRKMNAYMAGCMHSGMTKKDFEEVKTIQAEYDKIHSKS